MGFRVHGLVFSAWGLGGVQDSGFRNSRFGFEFRAQGSGLRFRVSGSGFRVQGLRFRV